MLQYEMHPPRPLPATNMNTSFNHVRYIGETTSQIVTKLYVSVDQIDRYEISSSIV